MRGFCFFQSFCKFGEAHLIIALVIVKHSFYTQIHFVFLMVDCTKFALFKKWISVCSMFLHSSIKDCTVKYLRPMYRHLPL